MPPDRPEPAGVPQEDLQPLIDLEASIDELKALAQGEGIANRRKRKPPSDIYLARMAAVIDLLRRRAPWLPKRGGTP